MTPDRHKDPKAPNLLANEDTTVTPVLSLRPKQAALALGIGERLLWELTNRGEIPCVRIGRCVTYPIDQLREWLADQVEGGIRS